MIMPHTVILSSYLCPSISIITLPSPQCNYTYFSFVIFAYNYRHCLLGCILFIYIVLKSQFHFPYIFLLALKSSLPIYDELLLII